VNAATKLSYSIKEAVEASGLSATHLDTAIRKGLLKTRRTAKDDETGAVSGKRVILARDLSAYLENLPEG
jgi:hypothetical protein